LAYGNNDVHCSAIPPAQHPDVDTHSQDFASLALSHDQCKDLAFQLIDSVDFIGKRAMVFNQKGHGYQTSPVDADGDHKIKSYLKAFIEFDRTSLEQHFHGFDANEAQHNFVCEVINRRSDLHRLYLEFQRDVVERSKNFYAMP
jgi:hypothetical protein